MMNVITANLDHSGKTLLALKASEPLKVEIPPMKDLLPANYDVSTGKFLLLSEHDGIPADDAGRVVKSFLASSDWRGRKITGEDEGAHAG